MSIATFAGILAQTQAADSRCISCAAAAALAPTARFADEAAALRGQAIGDPPELIPGGSGKYGR